LKVNDKSQRQADKKQEKEQPKHSSPPFMKEVKPIHIYIQCRKGKKFKKRGIKKRWGQRQTYGLRSRSQSGPKLAHCDRDRKVGCPAQTYCSAIAIAE